MQINCKKLSGLQLSRYWFWSFITNINLCFFSKEKKHIKSTSSKFNAEQVDNKIITKELDIRIGEIFES